MITEYRIGKYRVFKFMYKFAFWCIYTARLWKGNSLISEGKYSPPSPPDWNALNKAWLYEFRKLLMEKLDDTHTNQKS